ncbi:glycoside hydrolase 3 protein [Phlyctochytrium planicorne]|nr:glycoside hydrolase 3 protein [Phlyctochytrium planicorne]
MQSVAGSRKAAAAGKRSSLMMVFGGLANRMSFWGRSVTGQQGDRDGQEEDEGKDSPRKTSTTGKPVCLSAADIFDDLVRISKEFSHRVKIFRLKDVDGVSGEVCRDAVGVIEGAAALEPPLQVWLGMWVDKKTPDPVGSIPPVPGSEGYENEMETYLADERIWAEERELVSLMTKHAVSFNLTVKGVVVGSEALFRGDQTLDNTILRLRRIRNVLELFGFRTSPAMYDEGSIVVTVADLAGPTYADRLIQEVDVAMINVYPYWESIAAKDAVAHQLLLQQVMETRVTQLHSRGMLPRMKMVEELTALPGPKKPKTLPIVFGEVGWPTAGDNMGAAVPSIDNLYSVIQEWTCQAKVRSVEYFWFEYSDERWKPNIFGGVERNFGLMSEGREGLKKLVANAKQNMALKESMVKNTTALRIIPNYTSSINKSAAMKFTTVFTSILAIGASVVMAKPGKAPICAVAKAAAAITKNMQPNMKLDDKSYTFTASAKEYSPGDKIDLILDGAPFKGFLLYVTDDAQATTAAGNPMPMGTFDENAFKASGFQNNGAVCEGSESPASSVTHTLKKDKNDMYQGKQTFSYTVSSKAKGNLNVNVAVVQKCPETGVFSYWVMPKIITIPPKGGKSNQGGYQPQPPPMYGNPNSQVAPVPNCPTPAPVVITQTSTITNMKTTTLTTTMTTNVVQTQVQIRKCTKKGFITPGVTPVQSEKQPVQTQVYQAPPMKSETPCCGNEKPSYSAPSSETKPMEEKPKEEKPKEEKPKEPSSVAPTSSDPNDPTYGAPGGNTGGFGTTSDGAPGDAPAAAPSKSDSTYGSATKGKINNLVDVADDEEEDSAADADAADDDDEDEE